MKPVKVRYLKLAPNPYKTSRGKVNVPIWTEAGNLRHWQSTFMTEEEAKELNGCWVEVDFENETWEKLSSHDIEELYDSGIIFTR